MLSQLLTFSRQSPKKHPPSGRLVELGGWKKRRKMAEDGRRGDSKKAPNDSSIDSPYGLGPFGAGSVTDVLPNSPRDSSSLPTTGRFLHPSQQKEFTATPGPMRCAPRLPGDDGPLAVCKAFTLLGDLRGGLCGERGGQVGEITTHASKDWEVKCLVSGQIVIRKSNTVTRIPRAGSLPK